MDRRTFLRMSGLTAAAAVAAACGAPGGEAEPEAADEAPAA
ncbi:MAG: twin-arginine translocation signal domain-containing protein [Caldilineaceae bacterium]|nr:twin-arginine translocation signal domain-containing protein [Caldilineaceae bacterium]MCY4118143.1 twin-arginine translocation signal domain-containing protein [Caldilineaceae bacterium]